MEQGHAAGSSGVEFCSRAMADGLSVLQMYLSIVRQLKLKCPGPDSSPTCSTSFREFVTHSYQYR